MGLHMVVWVAFKPYMQLLCVSSLLQSSWKESVVAYKVLAHHVHKDGSVPLISIWNKKI